MQEVIADFARLNRRPEFDGESIPLGSDISRPELAALADGQRVLLLEPGNLKADGRIAVRIVDGIRYFYGVVVGPVLEDAA